MSHTPGPWRVVGTSVRTHRGDIPVALAHRRFLPKQKRFDEERAEADARLIAAAPDLLAACEEVVRVTHPGDPGRAECRAAIAKAKGES